MIRILGGIILLAGLVPQTLLAQNPHAEEGRLELGLGLAAPFLQGGSELLRSRELRSDGSSYYEGTDGTRRNVGSYGSLVGFSLNVGYRRPVERIGGMMLGAMTRATLTGSQPSGDGYDEGYFFNSVTLALSGRYYPSERRNLFVRAEAGVGSVLTKNRFRGEDGNQRFFHQFGIGPAGAVAVGYSLTPFSSGITLDLQAVYQQLRTRVEVDGVGDDPWTTGALQFVVSLGL